MALIIRIDVDRPYGKRPLARHFLSRIASDLYFPRLAACGFLAELRTMLSLLNERGARAYVFFRRCTLPSRPLLELLRAGNHEIGLHLEDSRSFETFLGEKRTLERHIGREVVALSKHGSGVGKFGRRHDPRYEPAKYIQWAETASMRLFLGNLQDPSLEPSPAGNGLMVFPSAFWLEPPWRDLRKFTPDWLLRQARDRDIVLLAHPENVLASPGLLAGFTRLIDGLESRILR